MKKSVIFSLIFLSLLLAFILINQNVKRDIVSNFAMYTKSEMLDAKMLLAGKDLDVNGKLFSNINDKDFLNKNTVKKISKIIYINGSFDKRLLVEFYDFADKALTTEDLGLQKETLRLLLFFSLMKENGADIPIYSDGHRNALVVSLLNSQHEIIRMISFSLATYLSNSDLRVKSNLIDVFSNPQYDNIQPLHYVRELGRLMKEKDHDGAIEKTFVNRLSLYEEDHSDQGAQFVEIANQLSLLNEPPKMIIPDILGMLENQYFGEPFLLDAIERFGPSMKPYLGRLKNLEKEVDSRISLGRDENGKGNTTFSKNRYKQVLRYIESL